MSKREMALRYEPSPQALRAIAEELRAVGVELDSPSIRRALTAALEIEGPRLEQLARDEAESEIRSLRSAHQDALRILLEASGAELRNVTPPVRPAPPPPPAATPVAAAEPAPDPFEEPVLTPREAVARRRPLPSQRSAAANAPAHPELPAAVPPPATVPATELSVPPDTNLTNLVRQRLGDEAPPDEAGPPRRDRDDEPKRPIFRRGRRE